MSTRSWLPVAVSASLCCSKMMQQQHVELGFTVFFFCCSVATKAIKLFLGVESHKHQYPATIRCCVCRAEK